VARWSAVYCKSAVECDVICYRIQDTAKHMSNRSPHRTYCVHTESTKHHVTVQSLSPTHPIRKSFPPTHHIPSQPVHPCSDLPALWYLPHPPTVPSVPQPQPRSLGTQWSPRPGDLAGATHTPKDTIVVRAPVNVSSPLPWPSSLRM
jgi:hypothetical protein